MRYNRLKYEHLLSRVAKPGRYTDNEINAFTKKPSETLITFCFAYPDVYEVGFSHLGIKILYDIINTQEDSAADRVFAPWEDMAKELKAEDMPLFSLENGCAVKDFDVLGITLQSELTYSNILYILDLSKISFLAKDRRQDEPILIAGGPCASNPLPVADFFDAVLIGEGEEAILEIKNCLLHNKHLLRKQKLQELANIKGLYVPFIHSEKRDVISIRKNLMFSDQHYLPQKQLVPWIQPTHDRLVSEIMRGCSRGCRFCHAGFFYRPVREKSPHQVVKQISDGVKKDGWEEVALTSLSSSDYSGIKSLLELLEKLLGCDQTSLSLPSLRVDSLDEKITALMQRMQQTGITIAPEAGSQRLRDIINKQISEEEILRGVKIALLNRWKVLKLYFMIGLPYEEWSDIEAIVELLEKIITIAGKRLQINITISPFVPKPFTPFQWSAIDDAELLLQKSLFLKNSLKKFKFIKLKYHTIENQLLECVLGRGDRKISDLILRAYELGACFDGWNEYFDFSIWQKAAQEIDIDLKTYLHEISLDAALPWDFINIGVDKSFLLNEYDKASRQEITPDCRTSCSNCGLCNEEISPQYHGHEQIQKISQIPRIKTETCEREKTGFRLFYEKGKRIRFIGHLDMLRMSYRLVRISGLPIIYSEGYNRHPSVSFGPPLPLGMMSNIEYFDLYLNLPAKRKDEVLAAFREVFPAGMIAMKVFAPVTKAMRSMQFYSKEEFSVELDKNMLARIDDKITEFQQAEKWMFTKERKKGLRFVNIKELVCSIQRSGNILSICKELTGASSFDVLEQVFKISRSRAVELNIRRDKLIR